MKSISISHLLIFTSIAFITYGCSGNNRKQAIAPFDIGSADTIKIETLGKGEIGSLLQFVAKKHDFGKLRIKKNPKVCVDFEFTNTGNRPLVILKTDVSCGCLSVDYPKISIQPNEKGKVTVAIDTKNQEGEFDKHVFVKSTAVNDLELLRIRGTLK